MQPCPNCGYDVDQPPESVSAPTSLGPTPSLAELADLFTEVELKNKRVAKVYMSKALKARLRAGGTLDDSDGTGKGTLWGAKVLIGKLRLVSS